MRHFLAIFYLVFFYSLSAQQPLVFNDAHGLKGKIHFTGEWSDTALPNAGPFRLNWRNLSGDKLITYRINGQLNNHLPIGKWVWEEAEWTYLIEPGQSIEPVFNNTGVQHYWEGSFNLGMPHGKWMYRYGEAPLKLNSGNNTLQINGNVINGCFRGAFQIIDNRPNRKFQLKGHCNEKGIATGIWEYSWTENGMEMQEERHYDQGILTNITRKTDKVIVSEMVFEKNLLYLAMLRENDQTLVLSDSLFIDDIHPGFVTDQFQHYFKNHFLHPWAHEAFPYAVRWKSPGFKRFIFPLSADEEQLKDSAQIKLAETLVFINEKMEVGNVKINRARNASLDLAISIMERSQEKLNLLDSILKRSNHYSFLLLNRDSGEMKPMLAFLNQNNLAIGEVYDTSKTLPAIETDSVAFFTGIHLFLETMKKQLQEAALVIDENVISIHKEGDLRALENKMEGMLEELEMLYENSSGIKQHIHNQWIEGYLRSSIQEYAQTDNYENAKAMGELLLAQMDSLKSWSAEWPLLDELSKELDIAYTQFAYNPYNGKYDIVLPLKKRFLNQAKAVAIPYLFQEIKKADDWESLHQAYNQSRNVRTQLIRFATLDEKSDRRQERRLRKENDADRFVRQFLRYMDSR